jgi:hypothetical protein
MNFRELKLIVGQIKKTINCPKCECKFTDEDIELIGGLGDEQTFFHASCLDCETESVINVCIHFDDEMVDGISRLGSAPRLGKISTNEVLDMSNFLKEFDGNFKTVFQDKKATS